LDLLLLSGFHRFLLGSFFLCRHPAWIITHLLITLIISRQNHGRIYVAANKQHRAIDNSPRTKRERIGFRLDTCSSVQGDFLDYTCFDLRILIVKSKVDMLNFDLDGSFYARKMGSPIPKHPQQVEFRTINTGFY